MWKIWPSAKTGNWIPISVLWNDAAAKPFPANCTAKLVKLLKSNGEVVWSIQQLRILQFFMCSLTGSVAIAK